MNEQDGAEPAIKSAVAGVEWPAVPSPAAAALLSLVDQFEQSEHWPPDLMRKVQFRQLTALINFARTTTPFWRRRLDGAGYRPGSPLDDDIWATFPIITRSELRDAGEAIHSTSPPSAHGAVRTVTTSGGRSAPIIVRRTNLVGQMVAAFAVRYHLWFGHDFKGKRAIIRDHGDAAAAYPGGRHAKSWDPAIDMLFETGPTAALDADTAIPDQVEWLTREVPHYLLTSPENLARLVLHALEHKTKFEDLRAIEVLGEPVAPDLRKAVEGAWDVPVHERYQTEETGWIGLQCPETGHYHAAAEGAFVEIVDGEGRPCAPGDTGRVVVTPLHNYATPVIRFDIGDLAKAHPPECPCGRNLPVFNRIAGRTDEA